MLTKVTGEQLEEEEELDSDTAASALRFNAAMTAVNLDSLYLRDLLSEKPLMDPALQKARKQPKASTSSVSQTRVLVDADWDCSASIARRPC